MFIRTDQSSIRILVIIAAGLLGAAALFIGFTVWWLRTDAIRDASIDTGNLATVLAEQTNRSVQSIDLMLNDIQEQIQSVRGTTPEAFRRLMQGEDTHAMLLDRMSRLSNLRLIALVGRNGDLINTTNQWPFPPTDLSDREYFEYFHSNNNRNIYVSNPVPDRLKGIPTVMFSKRLNDSNNEFLGVIVIGVSLRYFEQVYNSIISLDNLSMLLLRRDGSVILRFPDHNDRTGERMPPESPWYKLVSQGGGNYRSPGYFDNEARLIAARPLRNYPLVVDVGVSEVAALASWRNHAIFIGIGTLLALVCCIFLLKILSDRIHRLIDSEANSAKTSRELERANAKADAALNNMLQGLVMFDSSTHLVVFNQRYIDMFGLPPDIIKPNISLRDLLRHRVAIGSFSADEVENYIVKLLATVAEGKPFSEVTTLPDGRIISIVNRPMAGGGWVATHEDITERLRADEKVKHLARYDALTDLPNRATFYERMEDALGRLRLFESIAVLSLDLDRFKNVNDTLGHPIGDRLLQAAAGRMRQCVRADDIVARLGGDEFAVVQVAAGGPPDITELARRLIDSVGAPYDIDGQQVVIGVSVGIAIAPTDSAMADTLMKQADLALYRAKADGGGVYRFFEREMDARMQARRALELDLRKAVVNGEFEVYYQPIIDVKSGQITGCEALIRWNHPERGIILPVDFVPVAEEVGLIVPIGEWVLRQACAEAARWPENVTIAINLSPAQFKKGNLMQTVVSALASSGLPASRLELEITELVLLEKSHSALKSLHQLRDLGVKIAMDDFGTGYSSLSYLRSFPFDKIKIDQSFIRDLPTKEDSVAIIRAVVGLSSSLGITTTAEGVETKDQLARLTSEGCNEAQGFLFSPPQPAANIEAMLGLQIQHNEAAA
jgi:diguanylate cyclase (GGDEF)-like protein